ncbi:N-terminal C2 in EEIG1 and EHBP1 proteins [Ceratobasidium sp. AG-Ba]|nr:N-terminal C2 in EEIG1 and EHBP1 proteins [Ceratobasidium sp. AG-Ba]
MAHPPHLGLRAQIRNYFGKHATFSVHVHIHELANIPLVSGDFACRWRVKGAQALARRDSASGKSVRSDGTGSGTGSASFTGESPTKKTHKNGRTLSADAEHIEVQVQPPSPTLDPTVTQGSVTTAASLGESEWSSPSESSDGKQPSVGFLQPAESSHDHDSDTEDGHQKGASSVTLTSAAKGQPHNPLHGPGRGRTETVNIIDHTVVWDEVVEVAANMGIAKETKGLSPCELKLIVEQVPQHHEHLVKAKTTLGVVRLNLAEYVGKGSVTRRYLLRDSKTNATLKLTIDVKWLSGDQDYIAPPLQKAQIMDAVAGLMSNDRIMHSSRPHLSTSSSASSFYNIATPDLPSTPGLRGRSPSLSRTPTLSHSLSFTRPHTPGPTARTEQIIEALFNPVPTTNPNPSPFSYYAPARPPIRKGTVNVSGMSELDSTWSMAKAQQDAEARLLQVPNGGTESEELGGGNNGGWWKRLAGGSATVGRNSKRPEVFRRPSAAV